MEPVNRKYFFNNYRKRFGPMGQEQVDGMNFLLDKFEQDPRLDRAKAAYILATVLHETAQRFMPILELGTDGYFVKNYDVMSKIPRRSIIAKQMGNDEPGDGIKYRGAGYVQLTWKNNYRKMGELLGVDLVTYPEKAREPEIAYEILVTGMLEGIFTGARLDDYINARAVDYVNARRVVNGIDRAKAIARYATHFYNVFRTSA